MKCGEFSARLGGHAMIRPAHIYAMRDHMRSCEYCEVMFSRIKAAVEAVFATKMNGENTPAERTFFLTRELAQYFHVTNDAVIKWIKRGKLRATKTPGGHHRITREHLSIFLARSGISINEKFFQGPDPNRHKRTRSFHRARQDNPASKFTMQPS